MNGHPVDQIYPPITVPTAPRIFDGKLPRIFRQSGTGIEMGSVLITSTVSTSTVFQVGVYPPTRRINSKTTRRKCLKIPASNNV